MFNKIWIINQYNMPPEYGHLNRHYNFAKYLKKMGYEPSIFVGSYLHNTKIQMIKNQQIYKRYENSDFSYFFIKTCDYSNSKTKRVYAMFEYCINLLKIIKNLEKPDVIIGSSAHPLASVLAIYLAKKYRCKSIVEIRDLWPESFIAYKILKENNPLLKLLYQGEKWIYKKADKLIFTMEGGKDYIKEKGWDKGNGGSIDLSKIYHLNNGVDLEVFNYNKVHYIDEDDDINNEETFKVVYTGSIRLVNNLKSIVNAAKIIKESNFNKIQFLIFGEGNEKSYLMKYCKDNDINNVKFKGFVEKKKIPYILSKSNLNIIHFEQNKIKRYGASLNKLFDYFASGKPILSDCEFGYDLINRYKCGVVIDNATSEQFAEAVISFFKMPNDKYNNYCQNAIKAANDFDFKTLTFKLEKIITIN